MTLQHPHVRHLTLSEIRTTFFEHIDLANDGTPQTQVVIIHMSEDDQTDLVGLQPAIRAFASSAVCIAALHRECSEEELELLATSVDVLVSDGRVEHRSVVSVPKLETALQELCDAVTKSPIASLTLAQVLRAAEGASLEEAVNIESFAFSMLLRSREFDHWLETRSAPALPGTWPGDIVRVERDGEKLRVQLNHPERMNSYSSVMRNHLVQALTVALVDESVYEVELSGLGRVFSSGGDLAEFGVSRDVGLGHFVRTRGGAGLLLDRLGSRAMVRVHGACVGAGAEIMAFAHRVVAERRTVFMLPEVSMGLIPGAGGTASIARRIGRHRTAWLAITGNKISAKTALSWTLVDELYSCDVKNA